MNVSIRLFAVLAETVGVRELSLELPQEALASDAIRRLREEHPELEKLLPGCRVAVNGEYVDRHAALSSDAEVALIPPVSGGSSEDGSGKPEFCPFAITEAPLELAPLVEYVLDNRKGAVVTFAGAVREFTGDHQTCRLEYEAYAQMAQTELARIGARVTERWPQVELAAWHRTGSLEVGELSIVIAAAAPHRAEAFAACSYAIDRVKEDLPVWKKEVSPEGERWLN
jgi:molybdopterin synthase catalytic subunit